MGLGSVVVVGGGPAGAVTALLLAPQAERVLVLEKEADVRAAAGAGLALQPNGLAVLYALGLREALHEQADVLRSGTVCGERGRMILHADLPDFGDGLDHALAVRRSRLAGLLADRLDATGNVDVRVGARVTAVDPAAGSVVIGDGERIEGDVLVGADGVGSIVRRRGEFGASEVRGRRTYARVLVDGEHELPSVECWTPLGLFGGALVGDGTTYAFASVHAPEVREAVADRDLARFVAVWSAAFPAAAPLLAAIGSFDDLLINDVGRIRCRRWSDGRAVLVGDAVHSMAPNLGQGANSGFVDAAVLARCLRDEPSRDAAFAAYQRQRRRPVHAVQRTADLAATAAHVRSPAVRRVRDRVLGLIDHPALVARQARATMQCDPAALFRDVQELLAVR